MMEFYKNKNVIKSWMRSDSAACFLIQKLESSLLSGQLSWQTFIWSIWHSYIDKQKWENMYHNLTYIIGKHQS